MNIPFHSTHAGVEVPQLIYGTAWKKERTASLVEQALNAGFRGVDTACQPKHYNEPGVGEGLASAFSRGLKREEVFVQTKFTSLGGQDPERIPYDAEATLTDQVFQSFECSLTNLRVSWLDSLVLHSPPRRHRDLMAVWRAFESLHDQGLVRQLGVSNCYDEAVFTRLFEQATVKPAVLQNRFYRKSGYDRGLRDLCRRDQVVYQSFWTLTANPHLLASQPIKLAAERYTRSPEQVLFRALTQCGVAPLTGTTSAQHMAQDLDIFSFALEDKELAQITTLFEST